MLAIFDAEGVLFDAEYLPLLAERVGRGDEVWDITRRGIAGTIDWEEGLRARVEALRGTDYATCREVADALPVMPGAPEACRALKAAGWRLMAVSGGFTIMTERLGRELGLDWVFSNELLFRGGALDGVRVDVGADKAAPAMTKIREWGERREDVVVVADGANDLRLFDICGLGIAFRAQGAVRERADAAVEEKDMARVVEAINAHYGTSVRGAEQIFPGTRRGAPWRSYRCGSTARWSPGATWQPTRPPRRATATWSSSRRRPSPRPRGAPWTSRRWSRGRWPRAWPPRTARTRGCSSWSCRRPRG